MEASPPISVPGSVPDWAPYNPYLGIGHQSTFSEAEEPLPEKHPIGFIHFPDPQPSAPRRARRRRID
ncbi:hypothetical protein [Xanthobacter sp. YC-JY1]|uniref:hypothetical protein n=1 Tax=Xanthobacter sp. YC-JY1 TaxID=2419844 RepID=UPI001F487B99|nr:hypothetical protein [Xanthobacter sp. YC-JY1]UJX45747.1 hypothetical protein D7006_14230 [Xanthobacter sp. YC-JY1]